MTYRAIALVYDQLMRHVDYDQWVDGLEHQWNRLGMTPAQVLDVGCGTGSVLLPLAQRNYQVCGIDNSMDMLSICQDKLMEKELSAHLMEMDMRNVKLIKKVDAAFCLCDTLNYLTKETDLERCFKSIYRSLSNGGSFIFDMRTPHYYQDILADNQWVQREDGVVLIWENDFSQNPLITIELTFFVKQDNGLYRKHVEEHQQKCYQVETIKELAQKAGFIIDYMGADLFGQPLDLAQDDRMYFVALKESKPS